MLEVHQDTVPVDGMTIPPWSGENPRWPSPWSRRLRHQRWNGGGFDGRFTSAATFTSTASDGRDRLRGQRRAWFQRRHALAPTLAIRRFGTVYLGHRMPSLSPSQPNWTSSLPTKAAFAGNAPRTVSPPIVSRPQAGEKRDLRHDKNLGGARNVRPRRRANIG